MLYLIPVLFFFAVLALILIVPVTRFLEQNASILAVVVLLIFVYESVTPLRPLLSLGPLSVYGMDMVSPVLLALAFPFWYMRLKEGFSVADIPLVLFLIWSVLLSLNFLFGIREFGIQQATNEFRGYLYFISVGCYFASLSPFKIWPKIERVWLFACVPLVVVACFGYTDGDLSRMGRPLGAYATFFLLQGLLIGVMLYRRKELPLIYFPLCAALFPLIVLLQHRTVWVVMVFSFVTMYWLIPAVRPIILKWGLICSLFFGTLGVVLFGQEIFEAVTDSYEEAIESGEEGSQSTLVWRIEGWVGLLLGEQTNTPYKALLGNPFGTGWERVNTTSGVETDTDVSPHNFYLQTLLRSGLIGLSALVGMYYCVIRRLLATRWADLPKEAISKCILILLFSQLLYYVPYGGSYFFAAVIGVAISLYRETQPFVKSSHV
ncbi:O-antigen ligase family protein [Coraliomargarita sp. W4R53]